MTTDFEIAIGMTKVLPARMPELMAEMPPTKPVVDKLISQHQIIVLGPPIEGAAYGLSIANAVGQHDGMYNIGYIDANHFMKLKRTDVSVHDSFGGGFEDSMSRVAVVVWGFLSYVSQNVAHEIDAAINARITEGRVNIVTGWNQPTDSIKLDREVRNDFEHGYPLLGHYATSPKFSYVTHSPTLKG